MKKYILITLFSMGFTASMAQVDFGGMFGYGNDIEQLGIGVTAEFFINERMSLSPSMLVYFPETKDNRKLTYWEVNGDFHYYFLAEDAINLYGLAGLNLLTGKTKNRDTILDEDDDSDNELGVNLGLGFSVNVNGVLPYVEAKYVAGDAGQAVISLGARFRLKE